MSTDRPLIGILGGMGPAATSVFYSRLIEATPATRDQEHLPVVMWADLTVPDRTAALLGEGESIVPWLNRGVRALRVSGAEVVVCPCNTAHLWLGKVARENHIELLSIVESTIDEATRTTPDRGAIGILATDATLASGLYQDALVSRGLVPVRPEADYQARLTEAIYAVKAGTSADLERAADLVANVCQHLATRGPETIISACTEVSLVLNRVDGLQIVDSMDALVRAVVETYAQPPADRRTEIELTR